MKAVSVSAELTVIERGVEGAALLLELHRHGGLEEEDGPALAAAILALAGTRLRDLGRVIRRSSSVEAFLTTSNSAIEGSDGPDLLIRPRPSARDRGTK